MTWLSKSYHTAGVTGCRHARGSTRIDHFGVDRDWPAMMSLVFQITGAGCYGCRLAKIS